MVLEGFRVIRFVGSEVYNQPEQCAETWMLSHTFSVILACEN